MKHRELPSFNFDWLKSGLVRVIAMGALMSLLFGCAIPQMSAETRTFLNLSVEYLDHFELSQAGDPDFGGLSGLSYNPTTSRYEAIADAKTNPRVYSLSIQLKDLETAEPKFQSIAVEGVTQLQPLQSEDTALVLDPEGIAVTPDDKLYIASEGQGNANPPLIGVFDALSGNWKRNLPAPNRYLREFNDTENDTEQVQGIYPNLGFESLAVSPQGDRLFTATESALIQDTYPEREQSRLHARFLHYWIGVGEPYLVAEHVYPLENPPVGMIFNGLSELTAIDSGGHFLCLERAISPWKKYTAQLFQGAIGNASDTVKFERLPEPLGSITPIQKRLLLDLGTLDVPISNLEGMAFGPPFGDGSRSLVLVSDNGFNMDEPTQFLLLRVKQSRPQPS